LLILACLIVAGCTLPPRAPTSFPDTDIVFQTDTLLLASSRKDTLGFVNSDGTGLVYLDIRIPNMWGGKDLPSFPVIDAANHTLVFRIVDAPRQPGRLVLMRAGERAVICPLEMGVERPSLTADELHMVIDLVNPGGRLALYDLADCRPGSQDLAGSAIETRTGAYPAEGTLSEDSSRLAYVEWQPTAGQSYPRSPKLIVLDMMLMAENALAVGTAPAWSPDGRWLAYTGPDGIYLIAPDGSGQHRVAQYTSPEDGGEAPFAGFWPPLPSWSPDGRWLVYHKCTLPPAPKTHCDRIQDFSIFKVNVETGEEVKILDGGLNPYWRQRIPTATP
jgi:hypothetical protein